MKRPLVAITLLFCAGIIFASKVRIGFQIFYVSALILTLFSFILYKKAIADAILYLIIFCIGSSIITNSQILPKSHISRFVYFKEKDPYIVIGNLQNEPELNNGRLSFIINASRVRLGKTEIKCRGKVLAYLNGTKKLHYGDEVILTGRLHKPFAYAGGARTNYGDYLRSQGIYTIMRIANAAHVEKIGRNRGFFLKRIAIFLKTKMEKMLFNSLPEVTAGVMAAMILGEKNRVPPLVYNLMMKTGTVHILVVSGFNVGIVGFITILLLKIMRVPRSPRIVFVLVLLLIYCLMTGASNPIVRATIMAAVFMVSYLLKREADIYNSCCIAALFILFLNPKQLFDIGFQLSFMSVLAIVCLYPVFSRITVERFAIRGLFKFLAEGFLVSLAAWFGTMGIIAFAFGTFSPVTVLANIFIVPLATLITLCGISLVAIGYIFPLIIPFFASVGELLVSVLLQINAFMSNLPGACFRLH
ncbi:MAG: competence protein ComEC family protein [Candidatus Omnitrophica bacterium]|nr:competence protein ComEC family protein [Candidatus Omnitrophota bacterium]MBU1869809.1 competence protein ComEC family protein [Candidatus Omnitrophota bacterium]